MKKLIAMPFIKIYFHIVFSTLNKKPFLNSKELRISVWKHIKENAKKKNIFIDMVNGYREHCHCLVSLGSDQTIEKVVQLIKGECSHWINKNNLTTEKFSWQDEYLAVSVSESHIERVRNYIKKQEEHHTLKSFSEEYDQFINHYGFRILK
nr:transposase [Chryseobacterium suipulveris]